MTEIDTLAANAEAEIGSAKEKCADSNYDNHSRFSLWDTFRRWIGHPQFDKDFNSLEAVVLNELEFTLGDPQLRDEGWLMIQELAAHWKLENNSTMMECLRIASFEIAAEPPEYPPTLELLFTLASNPDTRWGVFAAYENYPWRLRPHARRYSGGLVTDQDCDKWLIEQGYGQDEILMSNQKSEQADAGNRRSAGA